MTDEDQLRRVAAGHGVMTRHEDWRGRDTAVRPDTLVAVLAALGVDAATPAAVRGEVDRLGELAASRWLPLVVVLTAGDALTVTVPSGRLPEVVVVADATEHRATPGEASVSQLPSGHRVRKVRYLLPPGLPLGWHTVHARTQGRHERAPLVVAPRRVSPPAALARGRCHGLMAQLYAVRSRRSWQLGDLRDLADLAIHTRQEYDCDFLLVNPLHATEPSPPVSPSPYLPTSRRFASPLYLRVEDLPEYAAAPPDLRDRVDALGAPLRTASTEATHLDRDAVWLAKRAALEALHALPPEPQRRAAYDAFRVHEGEALADFATWCAFAERHGNDWRQWPEPLRAPGTSAAAAARRELADRVEFHMWLQWLLDEQLAAAQQDAAGAGMGVGIIHDLAVGAHPGGADAWMFQRAIAGGASVGAPPDEFNPRGQDWSQPPWHPGRLASAGYAPYRDLVRFSLRHGGGLRADHVMGLFRLWWIPNGASPADGAYVRYDHDAMVGILALEAQAAGAVVVGEDLGTVEPWVREYLAGRGIYGTSMLWFEREPDGAPKQPRRWREQCLATIATHDLPPVAEYLPGDHIGLRERLGLLATTADDERAAHTTAMQDWLALLRELELLPAHASDWDVVLALHAFLALTPARLIGVSLSDVVGDRRSQNLPGTTDEYPNWRVPLTDGLGRPVGVEDLRDNARLREVCRVVSSSARAAAVVEENR